MWAPYPETADDVEGFASNPVMDRERQLHRSVYDAVVAAIGIVGSNKECAGLFKGTDPIVVLTSMVGRLNSSGLLEGSSFGFLPNLLGADARTEVSGPASQATWNTVLGYNGSTYERGFVTLNSSIWWFMSLNQQVATIFHELGHLYNLVTGLGASEFVNDTAAGTPIDDAQKYNRSLEARCSLK